MKFSLKKSFKPLPGFTAIELVMSLVVIGAIFIATIPVFQRLQNRNNLATTKQELIQVIRRANIQARSGKDDSDWGVRIKTGEIILFSGSSYETRNEVTEEVFPTPMNITNSGTLDYIFQKFTGYPISEGSFSLVSQNGDSNEIYINSKGLITDDPWLGVIGDGSEKALIPISTCSAWSEPQLIGSLDLPGTFNGEKIVSQGNYAYLLRSNNTDGFVVIDVSTPSSPLEIASLSLDGSLNNIFIDGNYVYVATSDHDAELQIIDVSTPSSPSVIGVYNDSGHSEAEGVFVSNSIAYVVFDGENELVTVDVSNPAAPSFIGGISLSGDAKEVTVLGINVFIASHNEQELQVIDASDPANLNQIGAFDAPESDRAETIVGYGDTVITGTHDGYVHLFDVSTPSSPLLLSEYYMRDKIDDMDLGSLNECLFVLKKGDEEGGQQEAASTLHVIDTTTPTAITQIGALFIPEGAEGVGVNDSQDNIYIGTDGDSSELNVISPNN